MTTEKSQIKSVVEESHVSSTSTGKPLVKISFMTRKDRSAVLEIIEDGMILWEGRKVTTDVELVDALQALVKEVLKTDCNPKMGWSLGFYEAEPRQKKDEDEGEAGDGEEA